MTGPLDSFTDESSLFTGSIGMGYHVNDYLRVELNGGILPPTNSANMRGWQPLATARHSSPTSSATSIPSRHSQPCDLSDNASNKGYSVMANGYVDLGTYVGFTPYIGGGVGVAYNKYYRSIGARDCVEVLGQFSRRLEGSSVTTLRDMKVQPTPRAKFSLAYSIGAGFSYQVTKNVSVDLGYEYFSAPGAKFVAYDGGAFNIRKGVDYQTVKLGLRYDLW